MAKNELEISSTILTTKINPARKRLASGKLASLTSDNFAFYLIEIVNVDHDLKVLKKVTQIIENSVKTAGDVITPEHYEKIISSVNQGLARVAESGENSWIGNFNAIIGLVHDNEVFLTQSGQITGYIFRKNKISALTEKNSNKESHPIKTFTDITSGNIVSDDLLVFGNESFFNRLSIDRLRTTFNSGDPAKELLNLAKYLKKSGINDANAIIIKTTDKTDLSQSDKNEIPDMVLIEESEESFGSFIKKKFLPQAILTCKYLGNNISKYSKIIYKNAKIIWQGKIRPILSTLFSKSKNSLSNTVGNKISLQIGKLKEDSNLTKLKIDHHNYQEKHTANKAVDWIKIALAIASNIKWVFKKKNRKVLYGSIIVIVILFSYFQLRQNNDSRSERAKEIKLVNTYDQAQELFQKTKDNITLGKTDGTNELTEALNLARASMDMAGNQERAGKLISDIQKILDDKTKTIRFYPENGNEITDNLTLITLAGSIIYSVTDDGKIYIIDTREQESKLIATLDKDSGAPKSINYFSSDKKIVIATVNKNVYALDIETKTIEKLAVSTDPKTWELANSIAAYSTNLYLLDSENGVLWKHTKNDDGYNKGSSYLEKKTSIRGAVDFSVDGNIFILQNDGKVNKFVKGSIEPDFSLKNMPNPDPEILIPSKIFTDEDTNSLFVLDKKINRILKFDKSGEYSNQYIFNNISIDNFVVNAKLQKIWVISDGKIYEGTL